MSDGRSPRPVGRRILLLPADSTEAEAEERVTRQAAGQECEGKEERRGQEVV